MFSVSLERRLKPSARVSWLTYLGGIVFGLAISAAVLILAGVPADALSNELVAQIFFDSAGLAQTLTLAIPLILAGLSAAIALRVGFWNIGIEGQLWLGAIGATGAAVQSTLPGSLPLITALASGAVAGALWIGIPLLLRQLWGVSEMVVTLLMSNIAYLLMQHLLFGAWRDPENSFPVSVPIGESARWAQIGFGNVHAGVFLSLATALLIAIALSRTPLGFNSNAAGANPTAARGAGVPVGKTITMMVLIAGALSGLAGAITITGTEYRLTQFIGVNATFSGIVIAFVARLKPFAVLLVAFVVAGVYNAGTALKVFYSLSEGIVVLIQSVVLLSLLCATFFCDFRLHVRSGRLS